MLYRRAPLSESYASLQSDVTRWLATRGRTVRPTLTAEQRHSIRSCFELLDDDDRCDSAGGVGEHSNGLEGDGKSNARARKAYVSGCLSPACSAVRLRSEEKTAGKKKSNNRLGKEPRTGCVCALRRRHGSARVQWWLYVALGCARRSRATRPPTETAG